MRFPQALCFFAMVSMFFGVVPSQQTLAAEDQEFAYVDSSLSNGEFGITTLMSGNQIGGCAVISLKTKPRMVFMMLISGAGTLSVAANHYKMSTANLVSTLKLNIGKNKLDKAFVVDGSTATFDLTETEIEQATQAPMSINGVAVDGKTFKALHALAIKCMSAER